MMLRALWLMCPAENLTSEDDIAFYNRALIDLSARADDARVIAGVATHHAKAVSPICGSEVEINLRVDAQGRIEAIGYKLAACALTKSVVAVFQDAAIGADIAEIRAAHGALAQLLAGETPLWPNAKWAELQILAPLKDHRPRHNAMQLPFEAAEKALK